MATQETLAAYVDSVRHKFIDVDGVFGAQCWDQWSHYATNFLGVPSWPTYTNAGGTDPHAGYACNVHHNARAAGLTEWFDILPADATPRAGDVAFWDYGSTWYPWSHVATVLDVTHGGRMLRCLTQNPGAVQIADLTTNGIIGYLRPKSINLGLVNSDKQAPVKRKKWIPQMFMVRYKNGNPKGGTGWLIVGVPKPEILVTQQQARSILDQWGVKNSTETDRLGWLKYLRMSGMSAADIAALKVK